MTGIASVFLLVHGPKPPNTHATGKPGSAQVAAPISLRVRPADRRAIDRVLDRFIPDGIGHRSMAAAWRMAGPELRASSTLREWRRDVSPLPYYPVAGTTFHDWRTLDAGRDYVELTILLSPRRGSRLGAWGFSGEMVRRGSHWLVNRFYTAATYNRAGVQVGPDVVPGGGGGGGVVAPALSGDWLIVPIVGLFAAAVLFPLGFLLVSWLRDVRWRRRNPSESLPPLPGGAALRTRSGGVGRL